MKKPDVTRVTPAREDLALARQARLAGGVMAGAMIAWFALQMLGSRLGWEARYAFLIDFAAIGALVWGLIVTARIWRRRKSGRRTKEG